MKSGENQSKETITPENMFKLIENSKNNFQLHYSGC